jgi:cation diffusion facilitator family transporter
VSPQRRTALASVCAAAALVALKLTTGFLTSSLGLVSEGLHSATDLIAALLTFFAIGVAARPADTGHPYGHGKVEHLSALAEGAILVAIALVIVWRAISNLAGRTEPAVDPRWYAFVVVGIVLAVDLSRLAVSARGARRFRSPALQANAYHFASDFFGTLAVLGGLVGARAGYPETDSAAALFVAALVLAAATRLMLKNIDVLMDRAPAASQEAAREAIEAVSPRVTLRRLRMRQAAGRHFADVVIGVSGEAGVGQGHEAADLVEAAVQRALPGTDVVVHVEPDDDGLATRDRARSAAMSVPRVREVHNVNVVDVDGSTQISLHIKLPGDLPLEEAHAVATAVEDAIQKSIPGVTTVHTHLEPLAERATGRGASGETVATDVEVVTEVVREATGAPPRALRFLETDDGVVGFLTLGLDPGVSLAQAHERARTIEQRILARCPSLAEVVVHTEP